jgi:hypothetical protein
MLALADDAALARLAKTSFSTSGKELHQFNVPITRATFTKNELSPRRWLSLNSPERLCLLQSSATPIP